ncbi:MAG: hypothetical protein MUP21_08620, partial [Dehalococcoidia bacterium]|nr:hypothetical protein [Dehalococcoidia bacterium]
SGQDCDEAGARLLSGHCSPSRWRLGHLQIEPTDHNEGIRPVSSRVRPELRWPDTLSQSVVNRSGKMSVHERIDVDYKGTGKVTDLERSIGGALVHARDGRSSGGE